MTAAKINELHLGFSNDEGTPPPSSFEHHVWRSFGSTISLLFDDFFSSLVLLRIIMLL
jgi:hypothetical protein